MVFIFRNGLATGEVSAAESHSVTETVQDVVGAIDPTSPIATAEGAEFDLLHACVREAAHFIEYFLFAALAFGTFLSFVQKGKWRYAFIPPIVVVLTVFTDEYLQSLTAGRGAQMVDVMVDLIGALFGLALSLLVFWAVKWLTHALKIGEVR